MSCNNCNSIIITTINMCDVKNQYIKLFRKLFPKKPIVLNYCTVCYNQMISDFETEFMSQLEHEKNYTNNQIQKSIENSDSVENQKISRYICINDQSHEYKKIAEKFSQTLKYQIIRIEKSNNPMLEKKFLQSSKKIQTSNIKFLFHGSNNKAYDKILETGFDINYSSPNGLLGQGIYFAENASYSHTYGRILKTNIGQINHLLYCKVNLGLTCLGYTGLTQNPNGFDGVHSEHETYCVFDNHQGIPQYIIYYMVDN